MVFITVKIVIIHINDVFFSGNIWIKQINDVAMSHIKKPASGFHAEVKAALLAPELRVLAGFGVAAMKKLHF